MAIELVPMKSSAMAIARIAASSTIPEIHTLLRHIKWQDEEIERVREERDSLLDTDQVISVQTGEFASKTKEALSELADARAMLADIRAALDIPDSADPVAAVKSMQTYNNRQAARLMGAKVGIQQAQEALASATEHLYR
jgi:hypothetical protein